MHGEFPTYESLPPPENRVQELVDDFVLRIRASLDRGAKGAQELHRKLEAAHLRGMQRAMGLRLR